jgi:hypothetical protein
MAGARTRARGRAPGVAKAVQRFIWDIKPALRAQPALDVEGTGQPGRGRQAPFALLGPGWRGRLRAGRRARLCVGQEGLEAPGPRAVEPRRPGIPMQGEMRRGLPREGTCPALSRASKCRRGWRCGSRS